MPRIDDPSKYRKTSQDKEIEKLERELEREKAKQAKAENTVTSSPEKKKREPKWPLIYVLIAIGVFFLGLLVIALMNLGIHGEFTL